MNLQTALSTTKLILEMTGYGIVATFWFSVALFVAHEIAKGVFGLLWKAATEFMTEPKPKRKRALSTDGPEIELGNRNVPHDTWAAPLSAFSVEATRPLDSKGFMPRYQEQGNRLDPILEGDVKDRVEQLQAKAEPLYTDSSMAMPPPPSPINARPEGQPEPSQPGAVVKKERACVIC